MNGPWKEKFTYVVINIETAELSLITQHILTTREGRGKIGINFQIFLNVTNYDHLGEL